MLVAGRMWDDKLFVESEAFPFYVIGLVEHSASPFPDQGADPMTVSAP